jgi:hypothetical protein
MTTPKKIYRTRAAVFFAENRPYLETLIAEFNNTKSLEVLIHKLHTELIQAYIEGVGIGAKISNELENETAESITTDSIPETQNAKS